MWVDILVLRVLLRNFSVTKPLLDDVGMTEYPLA